MNMLIEEIERLRGVIRADGERLRVLRAELDALRPLAEDAK